MNQIQRIDKPVIYKSPQALIMPANLSWAFAPGRTEPKYFRYSESWDGTTAIWKTPAPDRTFRLPTHAKPRMWRENGLWHCQHPDSHVRGKGTTMRWAYIDQLAHRVLNKVYRITGE